jgi:hypothetical protein
MAASRLRAAEWGEQTWGNREATPGRAEMEMQRHKAGMMG